MPLPNITWIRDGYTYEGSDNATIVTYALDDHHVISEIRFHPLWDDRGFYTCVARNQHGSDRGSFYNEKGNVLLSINLLISEIKQKNGILLQRWMLTIDFYSYYHKLVIYEQYLSCLHYLLQKDTCTYVFNFLGFTNLPPPPPLKENPGYVLASGELSWWGIVLVGSCPGGELS